MSGDKKALRDLRDELRSRIKPKSKSPGKEEYLCQALDRYLERGDNIYEVVTDLESHLSSSADIPKTRREGDILLHVHRQKIDVVYDGQNRKHYFEARKGYSRRDITTSISTPIGLVEYEENGMQSNGKPVTEICFNIKLKFCGF